MESKTSKRNASRRQREEKSWQLRRQGYQLAEIAKETGVSISQACNDVQAAYGRWQEAADKVAIDLVNITLNQLDDLYKACQPGIADGDTKAITAAVRIIDQRCKILGVNKQKIELTANETPDEIRQKLLNALQQEK